MLQNHRNVVLYFFTHFLHNTPHSFYNIRLGYRVKMREIKESMPDGRILVRRWKKPAGMEQRWKEHSCGDTVVRADTHRKIQ